MGTAIDFKRVLAKPPRARTPHFAAHAEGPAGEDLSTDSSLAVAESVDKSPASVGFVIPKRHARRAVTRNLIRRQMRAAFARRAAGLPGQAWVLRLRQPFDLAHYPSAASTALSAAVRTELDLLLDRAAGRADKRRAA